MPTKSLHKIKRRKRIGRIAIDTEATGLDLRHGAMPFLVTVCNEEMETAYWGTEKDGSWSIDPNTREVKASRIDLLEIKDIIERAAELVLQNAKFDVTGLTLLMELYGISLSWPWDKTRDTLYAGHLLASNQAHDLTTMALIYLGIDILPLEDKIGVCTCDARSIVKKKFPEWRIAKLGLPEMPSAKGETKENKAKGTPGSSPWKLDMWIPNLVAKELGYERGHEWFSACLDYAITDPLVTMKLWEEQKKIIREREYYNVYMERLRLMPALWRMECAGITVSESRAAEMEVKLKDESDKSGMNCIRIAAKYGYKLTLPKSGNNKSLTECVFDVLKIPVLERSEKTRSPSLNARSLERWEVELDDVDQVNFVKNLRRKRRRDTAIGFIENYRRFWLSIPGVSDWKRLFVSMNATGTNTLRFSSSNPNGQNLSKKEDANLRSIFGPLPGREWWSMDAENLELRIPAWLAGEEDMIRLFEKRDDPPYFGSYHLLVFDILHPEKFKEHGADSKKVYEDSWYAWVKNGNFAVLNGAVEYSGTADRAYHMHGAQAKIKGRLKKLTDAGNRAYEMAKTTGIVETALDRTISSCHGYPLICNRTSNGQVEPTKPWSYVVQGTAMWWMCKAMVRCDAELLKYNIGKNPKMHAFIILQVHDQLVFDLPKSKMDPLKVKDDRRKLIKYTNVPLIMKLKHLMEKGGDDVGVKTPVSVEYHPYNFADGHHIKL